MDRGSISSDSRSWLRDRVTRHEPSADHVALVARGVQRRRRSRSAADCRRSGLRASGAAGAQRGRGPAARVCRIARRDRDRRGIVYPTRVLSWRSAMKRATLLAVVTAVGVLSMAAAASQAPATAALPAAALAATQIEKVKGNLYMITRADPTNPDAFSGGNPRLFVTH